MNSFKNLLHKITHKTVDSVALVLSGGGARGAIEIGVLQALHENNIKIKAISGTSIGAIIGVFYCAGISPMEMKRIMDSQRFIKIFHFAWSKKGLMSMSELLRMFKKYNIGESFDSLNIPFYACASNLEKGAEEIFHSGNLHKAVIASASIPLLFEPEIINGNHYIDGGLYNNFPIEPLLGKYPFILGVHVNNFKQPDEYNAMAIAERVFSAVIKQNVIKKVKKCNYLIDPFLEDRIGIVDFRKTDKLFEIGYNEGIKFLNLNFSKVQNFGKV